MTTRRCLTATLLLLALGLAACSGDDEETPDPILTITNQWTDEADGDHYFDLVSGDDTRPAGTFTGTEIQPDQSTFDLTGSWARGEVQFVVDRDGGVAYTATFTEDNPTRLVFQSGTAGQLVITRGE